MHNSISITILVKVYGGLKRGYEFSLLKKILIVIGNGFRYVGRGSWFVNFFTSDTSLAEESFFYKLYCKFIDFIYRIIENLRRIVKQMKKTSIIDNIILKLFKDRRETQDTFNTFFLFFSSTIIFINIIKGKILVKANIISIFIILLSLTGIGIKNKHENVIEGSLIFMFIKSVFSIDEGGKK